MHTVDAAGKIAIELLPSRNWNRRFIRRLTGTDTLSIYKVNTTHQPGTDTPAW